MYMVYTGNCTLWDKDRLYHTKGSSDPYCILSGVFLFVEHSSGFVIINNQVDINSTEIVKWKLTCDNRIRFNKWLSMNTTMIMSYSMHHSLCRISLRSRKNIKFSGAGTSHQNGELESIINKVVTMERTILIHALMRFPQYILSTDIWSMSI